MDNLSQPVDVDAAFANYKAERAEVEKATAEWESNKVRQLQP